jgi:hypothetical protein
LDHQEKARKQFNLGVGTRDGEKWVDLWLNVEIEPAQSIELHEVTLQHQLENLVEMTPPESATGLPLNARRIYQPVTKMVNESLEIWFIPEIQFAQNVAPDSHPYIL